MSRGRRLQPELVPRRFWGISAQELLGSAWRRRIRPQALSEAKDGRCTRCGAPDGRILHEEWEYDDADGVATLVGLAPVCKACHAVAHIDQVPTDYRPDAIQHLTDVNGITLDEAQTMVDEAFTAWEERLWKPYTRPAGKAIELKPWRVKVSPAVLARHPDMARLPERAAAKQLDELSPSTRSG
jgi:hypothetical protein